VHLDPISVLEALLETGVEPKLAQPAASAGLQALLYEPELTPAGLNLVDGRYAAFGYVIDGQDVLEELTVDDTILKARVIEGAGNLQPHA